MEQCLRRLSESTRSDPCSCMPPDSLSGPSPLWTKVGLSGRSSVRQPNA